MGRSFPENAVGAGSPDDEILQSLFDTVNSEIIDGK
jgi:hypothetical protein